MKQAIAYSRISTLEQSNWSIGGQQTELAAFCNHRNLTLVKQFVDEGQSAKSFDRADWQQLEAFVKKNYKNIDFLIVCKYDRFSRNLREALDMIHTLEFTYRIKVLSTREDIGIDTDSAYFFKWRTDLLSTAQFERMVIVERTRSGINAGKRVGRYLNKAPIGYNNSRDAQNKPIITINEEMAVVVKYVFHSFLTMEMTYSEIARNVASKFKLNFHKERVFRVLTNATYAGLIHVKEYQNQVEDYVPGIHLPIITQEEWRRATAMTERKNLPKRQYNETAYLKTAINCDKCFKPLTCGKTKGKTKYYWYYECTKHRVSFNIEKAHATFDSILELLSFTKEQLDYLYKAIKERIKDYVGKNVAVKEAAEKKHEAVAKKIDKLKHKFIEEDALDAETYKKFLASYQHELIEAEDVLKNLAAFEKHYWKTNEKEFFKLKSIHYLFQKATVPQRQKLITAVFGRELTYNGTVYRTPYIHPIFMPKVLVLNAKGLLSYQQPDGKKVEVTLGEANIASIELLLRVIREIA